MATDAILAILVTNREHVRQLKTLWDRGWKFYTAGAARKLMDGCNGVRILFVCMICLTTSASCLMCLTQCASGHVTWSVLPGTRPIAKAVGGRKVNEPFAHLSELSFKAK